MIPLLKHEIYKKKEPMDIIKDAAEEIAMAVENTIGPTGMFKMNEEGDIIPFGAEIINNMEKTPFMDLLSKAVTSQEEEKKDGTASMAYFTAMLLKRAFRLTSQGVHPTMIENGYRKAMDVAMKELENLKVDVKRSDIEKLDAVIRDALAGYDNIDFLLPLIRNAVLFLAENEVKPENIKVYTEEGGEEDESEVIIGHLLDYERKDEDMPESVDTGRILILDEIKIKKPKVDAKISIESSEAYGKFADMDTRKLKEIINKIEEIGANVVLVKGEIDERAAKMLAERGIMAFEKVSEEDIKAVAKSTGAMPTTMENISREYLGESGNVVADENAGCAGGVCHV